MTRHRTGGILAVVIGPLRLRRCASLREQQDFVIAAEDHLDIALTPGLQAYVHEKVRPGRDLITD
ncbi:MAG: hypothetical protein V1792_22275 [Pseudomonadota bacterium]